MQFGIGSSIVTKDGKYTFAIHQTRGDKHIVEPMVCPRWFDTIDEAKFEGSQTLTKITAGLKEDGFGTRRLSAKEIKKTQAAAEKILRDLSQEKGQ